MRLQLLTPILPQLASLPLTLSLPPFTAQLTHPSFGTTKISPDGWLIGPAADPNAPWLQKATDWIPAFLHYMQDTWKPRGGVAVTEFGFAEPYEAQKTDLQQILNDPIRTAYYRDYMKAVLAAMHEGVRVVGTLAWSLVDNFEVS